VKGHFDSSRREATMTGVEAKHLAYLRDPGVSPAIELARIPDGTPIRTAGMVIACQRPGSASGFIFLSLEDETGISNAIIRPDLYEQNRLVISRSKFLIIEGQLQNLDGTLSVKAAAVKPLNLTAAATSSHDFGVLGINGTENPLNEAVSKPRNEESMT
jgi:error-prone DNA polymerase